MTIDRRGDLGDGDSEAGAGAGAEAADSDERIGAAADAQPEAGDGDTEDRAEQDDSAADLTLGPPGARLRAAREARELSLDDLARTMNLSRRVLVALEADDYAALPSPTFVRGYIKSLARLLGEAPQPLLDAYEARGGALRLEVRPTPRIESAQGRASLAQRRPGMVMVAVTMLILLALAGLALVLWPDVAQRSSVPIAGSETIRENATSDGDAAVAPELSRAADTSNGGSVGAAAAVDAAAGAAGRAGEPDTVNDPSGDAPSIVRGDPPVLAADEGTTAAAAQVRSMPAIVAAEDGRITVQAGGEDHLHFVFTGECWVEVRDGEDRAVYQDLNRAGQTLDLFGTAPFRLVLGYAPAVELTYNDSRVPLGPHTRNDRAALVIGR